MSEPAAALPDRGADPMVRITLTVPTSLRDTITALGESDRRDPRNMALVLLYEAVNAREKASKPVTRGRGPAKFDANGDPFAATDTGTPPVG